MYGLCTTHRIHNMESLYYLRMHVLRHLISRLLCIIMYVHIIIMSPHNNYVYYARICILHNLTTINIIYIIWKHHIIVHVCLASSYVQTFMYFMIYIMYLLCLYSVIMCNMCILCIMCIV